MESGFGNDEERNWEQTRKCSSAVVSPQHPPIPSWLEYPFLSPHPQGSSENQKRTEHRHVMVPTGAIK